MNLVLSYLTEKMYESINRTISMGAGTDILTLTLTGFNGVAYEYIKLILSTVALPIAYMILAFFAMLELWKVSLRMEGSGAGAAFSIEAVFRVMIRVALFKFIIDSSLPIMEAIFEAGLYLTTQIQAVVANMDTSSFSGLSSAADLAEIDATTGFFSQLGLLIELLIYKIAIQIIMLLITVICLGRFIEIFVYIAIAPIPLATLPSNELGQIGKNFLKSFAAICIQGTLIYLVLTFFPFFAAAIPATFSGRVAALTLVLILAFAVLRCNQWARSICNAM